MSVGITEIILAITAWVGGGWGLVRMIVAQFDKRLDERFTALEVARADSRAQMNFRLDERFAMLEKARSEGRSQFEQNFARMEEQQHRLERDMLELKADLPINYMRREDHIRFETTINAKLDAVMSRLDLVAERQQKG